MSSEPVDTFENLPQWAKEDITRAEKYGVIEDRLARRLKRSEGINVSREHRILPFPCWSKTGTPNKPRRNDTTTAHAKDRPP